MKKWILAVLFVILYGLLTFFGLGPVLLADGTDTERLWTFAFVLLLYAAITALLVWIVHRSRSKGR
jgi:membrane protein implicated in regulation of membrane protease activity